MVSTSYSHSVQSCTNNKILGKLIKHYGAIDAKGHWGRYAFRALLETTIGEI